MSIYFKFRRVAPLAVAALVGAGLPALALSTSASAADGTVVATTADNAATGWVTSTENAGLGTVGYQPDDEAPFGGYAALLKTGPGDPSKALGGKPYLNQGGYADTRIGDLTDLAYRTKTLRSEDDPRLAPAFNIQLRSGASDFRGSLVFEPVYNKDAAGVGPSTGGWQTWNLNSRNALWYSNRDTLNASGQVVIPANSTRRFGAFLDAWDANPTMYADMRVNPGAPGINISLGQRGYSTGTDNLEAEVDGVTIGSTTKATVTTDFESLGDCTTFAKESKTLTLTKDCSTTQSQLMGDAWTFDGAGNTLTAVENTASPNFPGAVVKAAVGPGTSLDVKGLGIKGQLTGSNSGSELAGIWFDRANGTVSDTTIDRITHGNGVQEGQGIWVTNGDATSPETTLGLDGVTITNYQKTGVRINGNVAVDATGLDVGTAGTPGGAQLTTIGANGVTLLNGPHGSINDSRLTANRFSGDDDATTLVAQSTALLVFNAGDVTASGLAIDGKDSDSGITIVKGAGSGALTVSCSTITRENGGNADAKTGIGVDNSGDADVTLNAVELTGWPAGKDVVGDVKTGESADCDTSVSASASPSTVAGGSDVTISGTAKDADGNGLAGTVTLRAKVAGTTDFVTVASKGTNADGTYSIVDEPIKNTTYEVQFTAPASNPSTSAPVAVVVTQAITSTIRPSTVKLGATVTVSGSVTPASGSLIYLQRKSGTTWVDVAKVKVNPVTGKFALAWKSNVTGLSKLRAAFKERAGYGASNGPTHKVTVNR